MEWDEDLRLLCLNELNLVCAPDKLNIEVPKLIFKNVSNRDCKGEYNNDRKEIIIFSASHNTRDDLFHSVRHEARHAWQWLHCREMCEWWNDNIAFYNLVQSPQFNDRYGLICVHELDAEAYATSEDARWEVKLVSSNIPFIEEKARAIFREISPLCRDGEASEDIRINYCALRARGWQI